jgi:hypothetical protein
MIGEHMLLRTRLEKGYITTGSIRKETLYDEISLAFRDTEVVLT